MNTIRNRPLILLLLIVTSQCTFHQEVHAMSFLRRVWRRENVLTIAAAAAASILALVLYMSRANASSSQQQPRESEAVPPGPAPRPEPRRAAPRADASAEPQVPHALNNENSPNDSRSLQSQHVDERKSGEKSGAPEDQDESPKEGELRSCIAQHSFGEFPMDQPENRIQVKKCLKALRENIQRFTDDQVELVRAGLVLLRGGQLLPQGKSWDEVVIELDHYLQEPEGDSHIQAPSLFPSQSAAESSDEGDGDKDSEQYTRRPENGMPRLMNFFDNQMRQRMGLPQQEVKKAANGADSKANNEYDQRPSSLYSVSHSSPPHGGLMGQPPTRRVKDVDPLEWHRTNQVFDLLQSEQQKQGAQPACSSGSHALDQGASELDEDSAESDAHKPPAAAPALRSALGDDSKQNAQQLSSLPSVSQSSSASSNLSSSSAQPSHVGLMGQLPTRRVKEVDPLERHRTNLVCIQGFEEGMLKINNDHKQKKKVLKKAGDKETLQQEITDLERKAQTYHDSSITLLGHITTDLKTARYKRHKAELTSLHTQAQKCVTAIQDLQKMIDARSAKQKDNSAV